MLMVMEAGIAVVVLWGEELLSLLDEEPSKKGEKQEDDYEKKKTLFALLFTRTTLTFLGKSIIDFFPNTPYYVYILDIFTGP